MRHGPYKRVASLPAVDLDGSGEQLLLLATLQDSLRTLFGTKRSGISTARQREELHWITSDDRSRPFAFVNVCDALGIDPDRLRERVLRRVHPSLQRLGSPLVS